MGNIKAILEIIKMIISTWKWAKGQIDDITYKREIENRKEIIEKAASGSKEQRLKNLAKLGKWENWSY